MSDDGVLGKFSTAVTFRDLVRSIAAERINLLRPAPRYAIVETVDLSTRRASVSFVNDSGTINVSAGSFIPLVGDKVRIAGIKGDKYIDDIIGDPTLPGANQIPLPPTGIFFTSSTYNDPVQGYNYARLTVSWTAPADDTNGDPLPATIFYNVAWQLAGDGTKWTQVPQVATTTAVIAGIPTGKSVLVRAQAQLINGHTSTWDVSSAGTTSTDPTGPGAPSAPTSSGVISGIQAVWDGRDSLGNVMPSNFLRCEVWYGTSSSFSAATLYDVITTPAGGKIVIVPNPISYSATYYVFFRIVTQSGVVSGTSVSTGTVQVLHVNGLVGGDITQLQADIITAGQLLATFVVLSGRLTTAAGGVQSGARVELDNSGFRVYGSGSVGFSTGQVFNADASGNLTLNGNLTLTSTGVVTGGFIVGTYYESSTGTGVPRVVINGPADLIEFYGTGGAFSGSMNGAGSGVVLFGEWSVNSDFDIGGHLTALNVLATLNSVEVLHDTQLDGTLEVAGVVNLASNVHINGTGNNFTADSTITFGGYTSPSGGVTVNGAATSASAPNLRIGAAGVLALSTFTVTSSERHKDNIKPMTLDRAKELLEPVPVTYTSRMPWDDKRVRLDGFIAEHFEEKKNLRHYVFYDDDGRVDGIRYERMVAPIMLMIKDLYEKVEAA